MTFPNNSNDDEEVVISNDASYSLKSPFLKGEVAKDHVNRCLIARSKEMKKGYYNTSISNSGEEVRSYVPDSRKAYISSVKALKSLLYPELMEDEGNLKELIISLENREDEIFNKYCYEEKVLENKELKSTGVKFIPEEDAFVIVKITNLDGSKGFEKRKGVWNEKVNLYWEELVELYDEVFANLNKLMHDLDYFNPEVAGF